MARAGYCAACAQNVYLNADGTCVNGHAAEQVSNPYDVADEPVAPAPTAPTVAAPAVSAPAPTVAAPAAYASAPAAAPPKKKRTGLVVAIVIVALLLLCGCGVGAFLLIAAAGSDSSSSSGSATSSAPEAPSPDKAKIETAVKLVKSMAKADPALIKSIVPAESLTVAPDEYWTEFVNGASQGASVLGKETWNDTTLTIATSTNQGSGSMTFKVSPTDSKAVTIHTVRADKSASDYTVRLVDEGGAWKIVALDAGDGNVVPFDPEGLKKLFEAAQ